MWLGLSGGSGGGEEILNSGYIWKMEYTVFINGLDGGRKNKDDSKVFGLSNRVALA